MKRISFLFILFSFNVCISQQGWILQPTGISDSLRSVEFLNLHTGWAIGTGGAIIKTTNSGSVWTKINSGFKNTLNSISVTSDSTLFICGNSGLILKSTNFGSNWFQLISGTDLKLNSIFFINSQTGWISGNNGIILRTTDSGSNWNFLNSTTDIQLNSIHFANQRTGWTAGFGGIFNSTNGGESWSPQFIDGYLVLNSIFFSDSIHGWSAYYDNITFGPENLQTTNGGLSWFNYSMNNCYSISINFTNSMTGWSSGYYGKINHSTNGGVSWNIQISNTIEHLNSIFFVDSLNGWIAGNSGIILKTTNAGIITNFASNNSEINNFSLSQNYPNPFNPETIIEFELPSDGQIKLFFYDITGRLIYKLIDGYRTSGNYKYKFNAAEIPGGIYFYKLETDKFFIVKKMIILK